MYVKKRLSQFFFLCLLRFIFSFSFNFFICTSCLEHVCTMSPHFTHHRMLLYLCFMRLDLHTCTSHYICSSTLSGHPPPSRHHKILRSGAKRMLKATHHQVKDALKALDIDQYINQAYGGEIPGVISSTASKTFSQRSLRSPWPST